MGRVANSLLKVGEDNVTTTEATGQIPVELPTFITCTQTANEGLQVTTDTHMPTKTEENADIDTHMPTKTEENADIDTHIPTKTEENAELDTHIPTKTEENADTNTHVSIKTEVNADTQGEIIQNNGTGCSDSLDESHVPSAEGASAFEAAVADAAVLEAKWILNFEQFVAGIQQEPELCQFFAEQNVIDLSGTCVDPILSQYTRTVLAAT